MKKNEKKHLPHFIKGLIIAVCLIAFGIFFYVAQCDFIFCKIKINANGHNIEIGEMKNWSGFNSESLHSAAKIKDSKDSTDKTIFLLSRGAFNPNWYVYYIELKVGDRDFIIAYVVDKYEKYRAYRINDEVNIEFKDDIIIFSSNTGNRVYKVSAQCDKMVQLEFWYDKEFGDAVIEVDENGNFHKVRKENDYTYERTESVSLSNEDDIKDEDIVKLEIPYWIVWRGSESETGKYIEALKEDADNTDIANSLTVNDDNSLTYYVTGRQIDLMRDKIGDDISKSIKNHKNIDVYISPGYSKLYFYVDKYVDYQDFMDYKKTLEDKMLLAQIYLGEEPNLVSVFSNVTDKETGKSLFSNFYYYNLERWEKNPSQEEWNEKLGK
ncbi:MAG: hypothetical protein IJV15_01430 [Lachnospiraceae bacterium]|nr:hypothetical protein [Lachnospiraceae bacterium]